MAINALWADLNHFFLKVLRLNQGSQDVRTMLESAFGFFSRWHSFLPSTNLKQSPNIILGKLIGAIFQEKKMWNRCQGQLFNSQIFFFFSLKKQQCWILKSSTFTTLSLNRTKIISLCLSSLYHYRTYMTYSISKYLLQ